MRIPLFSSRVFAMLFALIYHHTGIINPELRIDMGSGSIMGK